MRLFKIKTPTFLRHIFQTLIPLTLIHAHIIGHHNRDSLFIVEMKHKKITIIYRWNQKPLSTGRIHSEILEKHVAIGIGPYETAENKKETFDRPES